LRLVLRSAESLSETAVTHRPQGVINVGIYMSSNIYYYYYHRQSNIKVSRLHTDWDFPLRKCPQFSWHGGHFGRWDAINMFINTFIFGEILAACAKEYLTAATYDYQVEVKVRDPTAAVDAIFPPVSCSDIISKQYWGRQVGLQTS